MRRITQIQAIVTAAALSPVCYGQVDPGVVNPGDDGVRSFFAEVETLIRASNPSGDEVAFEAANRACLIAGAMADILRDTDPEWASILSLLAAEGDAKQGRQAQALTRLQNEVCIASEVELALAATWNFREISTDDDRSLAVTLMMLDRADEAVVGSQLQELAALAESSALLHERRGDLPNALEVRDTLLRNTAGVDGDSATQGKVALRNAWAADRAALNQEAAEWYERAFALDSALGAATHIDPTSSGLHNRLRYERARQQRDALPPADYLARLMAIKDLPGAAENGDLALVYLECHDAMGNVRCTREQKVAFGAEVLAFAQGWIARVPDAQDEAEVAARARATEHVRVLVNNVVKSWYRWFEADVVQSMLAFLDREGWPEGLPRWSPPQSRR